MTLNLWDCQSPDLRIQNTYRRTVGRRHHSLQLPCFRSGEYATQSHPPSSETPLLMLAFKTPGRVACHIFSEASLEEQLVIRPPSGDHALHVTAEPPCAFQGVQPAGSWTCPVMGRRLRTRPHNPPEWLTDTPCARDVLDTCGTVIGPTYSSITV